jgi:hypothetical protein
MKNPWLDIPLADYEAHMALPGVGQAQLLSDTLSKAARTHRPSSIAVLGCSGGNGFEQLLSAGVERVVGIDINPDYIERTRVRFGNRFPELELFAGDVQSDEFGFDPVELVFAGLLFEYVDVYPVLDRIHAMLCARGVLVALLQLPSEAIAEVTPSPYAVLGSLASVLRLVPPAHFAELAEQCGFRSMQARTVAAAGGKQFHIQEFRRGTNR